LKVVLDEGVPRLLIPELRESGCNVDGFPNAWKGLKNGALLARLEQPGFGCLITCDKNMEWQQALSHRPLAVVVLPFQKLAELKSIAAEISDAVEAARPGEINHVKLNRPRAKT
jgi:hypothetical protein